MHCPPSEIHAIEAGIHRPASEIHPIARRIQCPAGEIHSIARRVNVLRRRMNAILCVLRAQRVNCSAADRRA